jgi:S-DNA-T family DNA segregation ATPase FtsK/SpoIIIE
MAKRNSADESRERKLKFLGILLILFSVLLLISLITHSGWDDRRIRAQDNPFAIDFRNQVGIVGALTSYLFFFFLGWLAIIIPFVVVIPALRYLKLNWRSKITPAIWFALIAGAFITMMTNAYRMEILEDSVGYAGAAGGYFFYHLTKLVVRLIGKSGSIILLGAGVVAAMVVIGYRYPFLRKPVVRSLRIDLDRLGLFIRRMTAGIATFFRSALRKRTREPVEEPYILDSIETEKIDETAATMQTTSSQDMEDRQGSHRTERKPKSKILTLKKAETSIGRETKDYVFPGLDLLADNPEAGSVVNADELSFTARALKDTLETFGVTIDGQIEKYPGPVITRFEFKPAAGVKVHQITNLSDDLALALQAKRIRIVAPIPGKAAVGVEIPNRKARIVYIKDIIGSDVFSSGRLRLPIALGKTISGKAFVANLSRMPHLLVAGATGSGKSVCINGIITSLIYRLHPRELKFIFIDPKMLELSVYSGIPYLGRPVVTNAKRAEKVLSDAVVEMESRYKKLAADAVRNIDDYNARRKNAEEKMPYIVIVVDELADMMMATTSSRIEMLITRLAQMARAVGIHLILATQRPSVDVITGLIKANFSARLAFQVASKIDSRTIIDTNGAEKLLGNGDMLFLQPGQPEPIRLHGAFISSEETERIVKFIKDQFPIQEKSGVEAGREEEDEAKGDNVDLDDPLFIEAAQTVIRHKQGSVSLLQRKLGIGYQRAARLIDSLEEAGIVGPYDGSKAREVLADNAFLEKLMASRSLTDSNSQ